MTGNNKRNVWKYKGVRWKCLLSDFVLVCRPGPAIVSPFDQVFSVCVQKVSDFSDVRGRVFKKILEITMPLYFLIQFWPVGQASMAFALKKDIYQETRVQNIWIKYLTNSSLLWIYVKEWKFVLQTDASIVIYRKLILICLYCGFSFFREMSIEKFLCVTKHCLFYKTVEI